MIKEVVSQSVVFEDFQVFMFLVSISFRIQIDVKFVDWQFEFPAHADTSKGSILTLAAHSSIR